MESIETKEYTDRAVWVILGWCVIACILLMGVEHYVAIQNRPFMLVVGIAVVVVPCGIGCSLCMGNEPDNVLCRPYQSINV
jgi:cell division protein FtsW (lipid II flippase)